MATSHSVFIHKIDGLVNFLIFICYSTVILAISVNSKKTDSTDDAEAIETPSQQFEQFMVEYGKSYDSLAEKMIRFDIFKDNLKLIKKAMANKNDGAVYGITEFMDLTWDEFARSHFRRIRLAEVTERNSRGLLGNTGTVSKVASPPHTTPPAKVKTLPKARNQPCVLKGGCAFSSPRTEEGPPAPATATATVPSRAPALTPGRQVPPVQRPAPDSTPPVQLRRDWPHPTPALFDYRKDVANYPKVRNQGKCECCWAMSTAAAMEILYSRKHKERTYFSIQQLLDCTPNTNGCEGGNPLNAFDYMIKTGLTTAKAYPYTEKKGTCPKNIQTIAKIKGYIQVPNNEIEMIKALKWSPLLVSLDVPKEIMVYREGVANPAGCRDTVDALWHTVVIVGHGVDYWILRNTWGKFFGDEGHYLLKKGICGVGHEVFSIALPDTDGASTSKAPPKMFEARDYFKNKQKMGDEY